MQGYNELVENAMAQLKAGFADMEYRHKEEFAALKNKYEDEIIKLQYCYNDKFDSLMYELQAEKKKLINVEEQRRCVEEELKKAERLNSYYKSRYDDVEKIDALIHELSGKTFAGVMAAFGCSTDDGSMKLLFGIVQEKHLDSAWLYMSNAINADLASVQDREIFKDVMTFAINAVANVGKTASYEIIMAEPGQSFDSGCMGRAAGSSQLGQVKEMLLPGYRYAGSGKVVHPALVLIRK